MPEPTMQSQPSLAGNPDAFASPAVCRTRDAVRAHLYWQAQRVARARGQDVSTPVGATRAGPDYIAGDPVWYDRPLAEGVTRRARAIVSTYNVILASYYVHVTEGPDAGRVIRARPEQLARRILGDAP